MLKISPAVSVNNVPDKHGNEMDYILYPDSEDKNKYYAMAERPTFHLDKDGNPDFNLTWYFGSGEDSGGICTMTVAMPMPDKSQDKAMNLIRDAINNDPAITLVAQKTVELCKAMNANDSAKAAALRKEIGVSPSQALDKKQVYDPGKDWHQFMPASANLTISPIAYKSGEVTVQAFANEGAYQSGTPATTSGALTTVPSLMNSNSAVVTFNLQELGANLFWHGMGGPSFAANAGPPNSDSSVKGSSVFSVTYKVQFDGLLPAASATVTLDKSIVAKLNVEDEIKIGTWGVKHKKIVASKSYEQAINDATEIVLPAVASDKDKLDVQKLLTDWAAAQLEQMAAEQLPAVKLDDLSIEGARSLSTVSKQSRTYKLTQAVEVAKNPQGQLKKIGQLVDAADLKEYFQLIDLNDRPYFNVGLTVAPPPGSRLADFNVSRFVVTDLKYYDDKLRDKNGKEVNTIEYVADAETESQKFTGTFSKAKQDKNLVYSYLVAYSDGTPSFKVDGITQNSNKNYLDLSSLDLGGLQVKVSGGELAWGIISSVSIQLQYKDWTDRLVLREKNAEGSIVQPFGEKIGDEMTYVATYEMVSGSPVVTEKLPVRISNGTANIRLGNPVGDKVNTFEFDMDSGVTKAQLRMEYTATDEGGTEYPPFTSKVVLDTKGDADGTATWKVPGFSKGKASFKVTKLRVYTDEGKTDITDLSGGDVDKVTDGAEITVEEDGLSQF